MRAEFKSVFVYVYVYAHRVDRVWPDEGRDSFRVVTRKERLEL